MAEATVSQEARDAAERCWIELARLEVDPPADMTTAVHEVLYSAFARFEQSILSRQSEREKRLEEAGQALLTIVNAVRDYLPPDGIGDAEFIHRVVAAADNAIINPVIRELENGRS